MDPGSYIAIVDITTKVVTLAFKTKQLWDQVKDVPSDIKDMLQELRLTGRLFAVLRSQLEVAGTLSLPLDEGVMLDCLDSASTAQCSLEELLFDLQRQLNASRKAIRQLMAVKFVLRKETLQRLKERLHASVRLLQLSHQILAMELLPELTATRVAMKVARAVEVVPAITCPEPYIPTPSPPTRDATVKATNTSKDSGYQDIIMHDKQSSLMYAVHHQTWTLSHHGRIALALSKDSKPSSLYLQMPRWWSSAVWEFSTTPSVLGSGFQYRVYNMRSAESRIFHCVKNGEIDEVQRMLSMGQASCLDIDEDGNSLLYHATYAGQPALAALFTGYYHMHPFSVNNKQLPGWTPLDILVTRHWSGVPRAPSEQCISLTNIFRPYLSGNEGELVTRVLALLSRPYSDKALLFCLKGFLMDYQSITIEQRLKFVRQGVYCVRKPSTIWTLLGIDDHTKIKNDHFDREDVRGSLLHSAALAFGFRGVLLLPMRGKFFRKRYNKNSLGWIKFGSRLTRLCAKETVYGCKPERTKLRVHRCLATWTGTPLITLLGGVQSNISPDIPPRDWDNIIYKSLRLYLQALQKAGIDLVRYGAYERDCLQHLKGASGSEALEASRNTSWAELHPIQGTPRWTIDNYVPLRIIDLCYSANPRDWILIWAPEFEWMAMEFWNMVERQCVMPCTWVDD